MFVGNNEFALKADKAGVSQVSAAVADRALYMERYEYGHLANDDLRLFLTSKGIESPPALDDILKHFITPRASRSLRQVYRIALDILDEADDQPVTPAHVCAVLNPV